MTNEMTDTDLINADKPAKPQANSSNVHSSTANNDKTYGMICHLSAFAAYVLPVAGALVGPLVAWMVLKDRSSFADRHGKESLNFQLTLALVGAVAVGITFMTLGIAAIILWPLLFALPIVQAIFIVLATIAAGNGDEYEYPLTIRFLK
jgi:uncharacterized protein